MQLLRTVACAWLLRLLSIEVCYAWKPIVGTDFGVAYNVPLKSEDSGEIGQAALLPEPRITTSISHGGGAHIAVPLNFENDGFGYANSYEESRDIGGSLFGEDRCAVRKYAFNHDGTAFYDNKLSELNQFTICFWVRFTNHSGDHVILTYSVHEGPRELQIWVANSKNSSFLSMAIKGQQVYRLNYPLRVRKWHHTCSSWNGKTGEWQVWLKAERIGRGFHNALVGHKLPAHGKLYSGGPSSTGELSQGLHFEITLVQVYRIALSAGKAHRDHKHHHVHHFDHEGQELASTTKPPPTINRPLPMHNLLANGQIPTRVKINLAQPAQGAPATNAQPYNTALPDGHAVTIHTNFVNGQLNAGSRLVTQQLLGLGANANNAAHAASTQTFHTIGNPANVQFIDETETRVHFKRQAKTNDTKTANSRLRKRQTDNPSKDKNLQKRGLVLLEDGSVVDDGAFEEEYKYDGLAEFGGKQFKHDLTTKMNLADEVTEYDREPAEEEVKAVMAVCSACDVEPFLGAIVFAWKDVKEQLDNALKGYSVGGCAQF